VSLLLQGRPVGSAELGLIRQLIIDHPEWSRRRLSQVLCEAWNWRNAAGQLKDMASRTLLVKLQQRGHLQLPARRQSPVNRMRATPPAVGRWDTAPQSGPLSQLAPLQVSEVSRHPGPGQELAAALAQFHYLGFGGTVGENLQYTVRDGRGRLLACLVFGAAAWQCQPRDQFIGWTAEQRQRNLGLLSGQTRFLILPWVQVPHLASWTLAAALRNLSADWQAKYGHPIHLVETFVQRDRFQGTAYQAAHWIEVGQTTGRTRQDRSSRIQVPRKDIYLYPLHRQFRERLSS
jgi:Druantia protein DruA